MGMCSGRWIGAVALAALPAHAQEVVPTLSGQRVTLAEVVWDSAGPEGLVARFRFVAPAIGAGGTVDAETALADMAELCTSFALPRVLTGTGPLPVQIVLSMSERELAFGDASPDTVQYFEVFDITEGTCEADVF
jgi:hypothetical protein